MTPKPDDALLRAAEEIIKTTNTIGWKLIMAQTRRLIAQARTDLETVKPTDTAKIIELQQEILCYRRLPAIAEELISQGIQEEDLRDASRDTESDDGIDEPS